MAQQDRLQYLFDLLQGKDQLSPNLDKATKKSTKLNKSIKGLGGIFKAPIKAAFSLKGALAAAGVAFVVKKAINEARRLENALIGLESVAGATGNNVSEISAAAKELAADGLIPLTDVSDTLKNLLATGFDGDKAVKVFKSLRDAAAFNRQGQLELGEAIRGAAEGLKNDLSIKVDNAGITKNLSVLQKEYAASIGKTIGGLTAAEKIQAKYTGIIREGGIFQGDYNKLLKTFSGATSEASGRFRFLLADFGELITKNPAVIAGIRAVATGFANISKFIKNNNEELKKLARDGFVVLVKGIGLIAEGFLGLIAIFSKASRALDKFFGTAASRAEIAANEDLRRAIESGDKITAVKKQQLLDQLRDAEKAQKIDSARRDKALKNRLETLKGLSDKIKKITGGISGAAGGDVAGNVPTQGNGKNGGLSSLGELKKATVAGVKNPFEVFTELGPQLKTIGTGAEDIVGSLGASLFILGNEGPKAFGSAFDGMVDLAKRGIKTIGGAFDTLSDQTKAKLTGAGLSIAASAVKGKAGAKSLFKGAATALGNKLIPGAGAAIGEIVGALQEGPESVRMMVREFAAAVPEIIQAIIESLPVLIEELAIAIPQIIEKIADRADIIVESFIRALVKATPRIIFAFIKSIPRIAIALSMAMPKVALSFMEALIKEAPRFVSELISGIGDGIKKAFDKITGGVGGIFTGGGSSGGGIGGAIGGVVSTIGGAFGFAKGGEVPRGFPNDSFPAQLTSGEGIVRSDLNSKLKSFLDNPSGGMNEAILGQILNSLNAPITVESTVEVNQKAFADIILELNRTNQRVS